MPKQKSKSNRANDLEPSLKPVVGEAMYAAWVEMLKVLVPGGRTHRLAVVVAGMVYIATTLAEEDDALGNALLATSESADPDDFSPMVHDALAQLFKDANMKFQRTSRAGESYSIIETALMEFAAWESYPWD